eukprot:jgi/Mesvir1/14387/Mv09783-RA.1
MIMEEIENLISKIQGEWDVIGEDDDVRSNQLQGLQEACMALYAGKLEQLARQRDAMASEVMRAFEECKAICLSFGENCESSVASASVSMPLKQRIGIVQPKLDDLRRRKAERMAQLERLHASISQVERELAGTQQQHADAAAGTGGSRPMALEGDDLTDHHVKKLEAELSSLQQEKSKRHQRLRLHLKEVRQLCTTLGANYAEAVAPVHPSLVGDATVPATSSSGSTQLSGVEGGAVADGRVSSSDASNDMSTSRPSSLSSFSSSSPSSLEEGGTTLDVSGATLAGVDELVRALRLERAERMSRVAAKLDTMEALWALLSTPEGERRAFDHLRTIAQYAKEALAEEGATATEAASDASSGAVSASVSSALCRKDQRPAVLKPGSLSDDIMAKMDAEVSRLQALKQERMRELVAARQRELDVLCEATCLPHTLRLWESVQGEGAGRLLAEDALAQLDAEIARVTEDSRGRAPVLALIDKYQHAVAEEKWLEEYEQDENRYTARGSHEKLRRAEKARAMVSKVPGLVSAMHAGVLAWEAEHGRDFLYKGGIYRAVCEQLKGKVEHDKEEQRRLREQKKLESMRMTEQELKYGSSPAKKPVRASLSAAPRRPPSTPLQPSNNPRIPAPLPASAKSLRGTNASQKISAGTAKALADQFATPPKPGPPSRRETMPGGLHQFLPAKPATSPNFVALASDTSNRGFPGLAPSSSTQSAAAFGVPPPVAETDLDDSIMVETAEEGEAAPTDVEVEVEDKPFAAMPIRLRMPLRDAPVSRYNQDCSPASPTHEDGCGANPKLMLHVTPPPYARVPEALSGRKDSFASLDSPHFSVTPPMQSLDENYLGAGALVSNFRRP